jgi:tRNA-Thr(GGU) m(6)t(6)A37 methyltransferase TsaA
MHETGYTLTPIGVIRSERTRREDVPHQGFEGAPNAWLQMAKEFSEGLEGIEVGREIIVITWFHEAQRDILKVHPRGDPKAHLTGVFGTRSPDRPNPLGLHRVSLLAKDGNLLKIGPLEAIDGTPVVDIKPVLQQSSDS